MRPARTMTPFGWLCLLAMLALSSPGLVTEVRAEGPVSAVPQGPSCETPALDPRLELAAMTRAAKDRAVPESDVVVLNNKGYRYGGTDPQADMRRLIDDLVAQQQRGGE